MPSNVIINKHPTPPRLEEVETEDAQAPLQQSSQQQNQQSQQQPQQQLNANYGLDK